MSKSALTIKLNTRQFGANQWFKAIWGAGAKTLHTAALSLAYSTAGIEHQCGVASVTFAS